MTVPNIAKRLCEAWVGAAVERVVPQAVLWSPSFRHADGFGSDAELEGSLLLQCSWAQIRRGGPSTRVSRALVETYAACQPLALRHTAVRFVLVGDGGAPNKFPLYTVGLTDIDALVSRQVRGTVDAISLIELQALPSVEVEGPAAEPLEVTLATWMERRSAAPASQATGERIEYRRSGVGYARQRGLGLNWPSALAVRFPRAARPEDPGPVAAKLKASGSRLGAATSPPESRFL